MKKIYSYESAIGDSGAKAGAELGVEGESFQLTAHVSFPVEKVIQPATKALDKVLDGLEKIIPGDWDKKHIEGMKVQFKEIIIDLISKDLADQKALAEAPAEAEKSEG